MEVSSLSMTRDAKVRTDARSAVELRPARRNVEQELALDVLPLIDGEPAPPYKRIRLPVGQILDSRERLVESEFSHGGLPREFDLHGERQSVPDLEFPDLAGVDVAHVGKELGDLRPEFAAGRASSCRSLSATRT